jgi:hypothetical protein
MAARLLTDGWTVPQIATSAHPMIRLVLECTQSPVYNEFRIGTSVPITIVAA